MNNNKIKIINDDEYDDDLSYGYNKFISFLNNNENFLNSIIILKYLPKNIRAFVDSYLKFGQL